ncbi:hypothetical protein E0765_03260 [Sulfuricurvum sp. IAE1]|jgi:hypothetical protein|uniref:hypothetical protein n=1 Tax=Sulfuricurvum sp. IAE1 TaxID=2546102 RepID=UPI00104D34BE|nr:hypothetical protein [Sulfuricurvum sp. IAE1]MDD3770185.1 hypothetical protein [Sulfuricurvum sp.]MDX9965592.1 hypothetical protein [Sulfuricurvum sp.]TDA68513.1 hypothetical protein E0765_03260 [Sulfuricurvum sp. IAE1]
MKKRIFIAAAAAAFLSSGCAEKQLVINGMICPAGTNEDRARADFAECRVYDLEAATKASRAPLTIECQKCLENKGYKIEQ